MDKGYMYSIFLTVNETQEKMFQGLIFATLND